MALARGGQYRRNVDARALLRTARYSVAAAVALAFYVIVNNPITSHSRAFVSDVNGVDDVDVVRAIDSRRSSMAGTCGADVGARVELDGGVVRWGSDFKTSSAEACCRACEESARKCNVWVWCGDEGGCGGDRKRGECWLKYDAKNAARALFAAERRGGDSRWTSGALFSSEEAEKAEEEVNAEERAKTKRRHAKGNHRVYLDVSIDGADAERIEFVLYADTSPLAAENFRRMCVGEPSEEYTWVGSKFYRILDRFIDQTGSHTASGSAVNPGKAFDDDPGGLRLKHDRPGLLSVANAGPNTNTGHFSIVMAPAPHLDGSYVIFGEVVDGMEHAWAINKLASSDGEPTGEAKIVRAGVLESFR